MDSRTQTVIVALLSALLTLVGAAAVTAQGPAYKCDVFPLSGGGYVVRFLPDWPQPAIAPDMAPPLSATATLTQVIIIYPTDTPEGGTP